MLKMTDKKELQLYAEKFVNLPQNPNLRNNPENFHSYSHYI